jgi:hypothetical protein
MLLLVAVGLVLAVGFGFQLSATPGRGLYLIEGSKSKHEVLRAVLDARGWKELNKKTRRVSYGLKWTWSARRLDVPTERTLLNHYANVSAMCVCVCVCVCVCAAI